MFMLWQERWTQDTGYKAELDSGGGWSIKYSVTEPDEKFALSCHICKSYKNIGRAGKTGKSSVQLPY